MKALQKVDKTLMVRIFKIYFFFHKKFLGFIPPRDENQNFCNFGKGNETFFWLKRLPENHADYESPFKIAYIAHGENI